MMTANFALMKSAPSSASAAEDMTALITWDKLMSAPLFGGMGELEDKKWCPPALLRAFVSDKYDASLWTASTMSLALKVRMASSCDAA